MKGLKEKLIWEVQKTVMDTAKRSVGKSIPLYIYEPTVPEVLRKDLGQDDKNC